MATYGEGDPTDNAHELYDWLQNDQDLEGINYAVCHHIYDLYIHSHMPYSITLTVIHVYCLVALCTA